MKKNKINNMLKTLILLYILIKIKLCEINGKIEGFCLEKTLIKEETIFCYNYIPKYVCVPFYNVIYF
jgi:hypothetical protein